MVHAFEISNNGPMFNLIHNEKNTIRTVAIEGGPKNWTIFES